MVSNLATAMTFRRKICCFFALAAFATVSLSSSFLYSQSESGQDLLKRVSSYLLDNRAVRFNAQVTIAGETGHNDGLFYSGKDYGYISLTGVSEYQYDRENIYFYNAQTNELTIQKRKSGSSNIFENPFVLFSNQNNLEVNGPTLEILDGKRVKVLTVKPVGRSSYKSAKIYLKENLQTPSLIKIDVEGNKGSKYQLSVLSVSDALTADQAAKYKIDLSAHKGASVNDLR